MGEDPLHDGRVIDRGNRLHSPGAARTTQDGQVERMAYQRRPRPVAGPVCSPASCPGSHLRGLRIG